jgi:hypothetical protein
MDLPRAAQLGKEYRVGGQQQQTSAEKMVTSGQGGDDDERPRPPVTETAPASAMGAFGTDHPKLIGKVHAFCRRPLTLQDVNAVPPLRLTRLKHAAAKRHVRITLIGC